MELKTREPGHPLHLHRRHHPHGQDQKALRMYRQERGAELPQHLRQLEDLLLQRPSLLNQSQSPSLPLRENLPLRRGRR